MTTKLEDQIRIEPLSKPGPGETPAVAATPAAAAPAPRELGGPEGPEPTRYGDWELRGRCIDF